MSSENTVYKSLQKKWHDRQLDLQRSLWEKYHDSFVWANTNVARFATSMLASIILLTTPAQPINSTTPKQVDKPQDEPIDTSVFVVSDLHPLLPQQVQPLNTSQEKQILTVLSRDYNVPVAAELQGIRLERNYGYIGQEQHLARFPGDTMLSHFSNDEDAQLYSNYGMAPGLGAYGYFATSAASMTKEQSDSEKYYVALQTFLAPGYHENSATYNEFFKFHKMLVVNPQNGKAVIAVIGDAGPAVWTGKQLGGSPELMTYLNRVDGSQRGPVLYFFIDDPKNKIPLGPITMPNNTN